MRKYIDNRNVIDSCTTLRISMFLADFYDRLGVIALEISGLSHESQQFRIRARNVLRTIKHRMYSSRRISRAKCKADNYYTFFRNVPLRRNATRRSVSAEISSNLPGKSALERNGKILLTESTRHGLFRLNRTGFVFDGRVIGWLFAARAEKYHFAANESDH